MSDTSTDDSEQLTCPECGERLKVGEEWKITDRSLIGTKVEAGESIQGDYAHAACLTADIDRSAEGSAE